MTSLSDDPLHTFAAADGTSLAWREHGEGRPVILIHGLFSNGWTNWLRYGHAAAIAAKGFRVIMPDLRGHGDSGRPHDAAHYPPDVLADDGLALVTHLGLDDYDLGGYSLGGRTVVRMLARGARPRRAIVAGMGLDGILDPERRAKAFRAVIDGLGTHPRGSPPWMAEAFMKTTKADPDAMRPLLDSFVPTPPEALAAIETPTLVIAGADDDDNGSAQALADLLLHGEAATIAGNHMSAVANRAFGEAIAAFLAR